MAHYLNTVPLQLAVRHGLKGTEKYGLKTMKGT